MFIEPLRKAVENKIPFSCSSGDRLMRTRCSRSRSRDLRWIWSVNDRLWSSGRQATTRDPPRINCCSMISPSRIQRSGSAGISPAKRPARLSMIGTSEIHGVTIHKGVAGHENLGDEEALECVRQLLPRAEGRSAETPDCHCCASRMSTVKVISAVARSTPTTRG